MQLFLLVLIFLGSFFNTEAIANLEMNKGDATTLHLDWINISIKPTKNFFAFANGNWQKNNPIPLAYSRWSTFDIIGEHNLELIHQMLIDFSGNQGTISEADKSDIALINKIGDFYYSGMNKEMINQAQFKPLQPVLDSIAHINNLVDLQRVIADLQSIGVAPIFNFIQMQDYADSRKVIGAVFEGGLGLPDRNYYLDKEDPQYKKVRDTYLIHLTEVFKLLGDAPLVANAEARTVMSIETTFADASMTRIEQRNPHNIYHMMNLEQLNKLTPNFSWNQYFINLGHPEINTINVGVPHYFEVMNDQLKKLSLADWKIYLRWHLINTYAPCLSDEFVKEDFRMNAELTGAKELLPRWKRVVSTEDSLLGFAIGKYYVKNYFPPSSKQKVQEILTNIRASLKNKLLTLEWMTPETRVAALNKLDMMAERIGYPDKWRDYSALEINRNIPYVLNVKQAIQFYRQYELNKIGKPVDRNEWDMTPQTVNAYYDPSTNRINIPAGILQPPFFDPHAPAAVNYGAIGFILGHEMTHGFDDQGAQFDGSGNLKNWWSEADLNKFHTLTQQVSDQFSQYSVDDHIHIQGGLVTGEATADLGGLNLAYYAFHLSNDYKHAPTIDKFTPDQQFFLGSAHVWAVNIRRDEARRLALTDPHPPGFYRVNGTLINMKEFQQAFNVTRRNSMFNHNPIMIW